MIRKALLACLLAAATACALAHEEPDEEPMAPQEDRFTGTVERVVDGDTFRLRGVDESVRIWGLDAPERCDPAGPAATTMLKRLISGQPVNCQLRDIDRYQRLVGQCFLTDGRDIAAVMIASGVATEYCRYSRGHYGSC
ncbi:thermonuclease family protein [Cereibacter sphaeroides]|uniref:thermonuclease family protein n=1 Tax=Cereibacter sphaeroides TaxID=1063 RepID=UPI001F3692C2|nr:thermonuclease family protein [Cereibacter sphaeroides]MCE6967629.1 thermonuclease family protein [Cereibacter sphaeroides]